MAWIRGEKRVRRKLGKKLGKYMTKRYTNPSGSLKLKQVARDVAVVKRVVNSEKKHFGPTVFTDPVSLTTIFSTGLTNGTGEGMQLINITPQIIKGDNRDNRNGNSVKLVSACIHLNLAGQSAQANNTKMIFEVYQVKSYGLYGTSPTPAVLGSDLFKQDPITNRYSANCSRNPNYFSKFRCIRRLVVQTPQDNGGTSNFIKNFTLPMKLNQHLRFDDSAGGLNYVNTEFFLVVRSNNGNCSGTVASATGNSALALNTAVLTGFSFQLYTDFYYYDN